MTQAAGAARRVFCGFALNRRRFTTGRGPWSASECKACLSFPNGCRDDSGQCIETERRLSVVLVPLRKAIAHNSSLAEESVGSGYAGTSVGLFGLCVRQHQTCTIQS
jgi:hypothetical protein